MQLDAELGIFSRASKLLRISFFFFFLPNSQIRGSSGAFYLNMLLTPFKVAI